MPILSKYTNEEVEKIIAELLSVLEKNEASTDLALMCLGNTVSNIINNDVTPKARRKLAENFAAALAASIQDTQQ